VDDNQKELVKGLRELGATVQHLHEVGKGCPDILVGYRGRNYLLEIKDSAKPPSKRRLTKDEKVWHGKWKGSVAVVCDLHQAAMAIGRRAR
jgi:hypothetical protein